MEIAPFHRRLTPAAALPPADEPRELMGRLAGAGCFAGAGAGAGAGADAGAGSLGFTAAGGGSSSNSPSTPRSPSSPDFFCFLGGRAEK